MSDEGSLAAVEQLIPLAAPLQGSAYSPPSITQASLRRRPIAERAAA